MTVKELKEYINLKVRAPLWDASVALEDARHEISQIDLEGMLEQFEFEIDDMREQLKYLVEDIEGGEDS
jgi:hypothetical protein